VASAQLHWPIGLHAARAAEEVWEARTEHLEVLCARMPMHFVRDGALTAFTFGLLRDGGEQYCTLLLKVAQARLSDLPATPKALITQLTQATPARYLLIHQVLVDAAQALRYAVDSLSFESKSTQGDAK
jgi:hypothetical protein